MADSDLAVLESFGIFNSEGISRLASLIRTVQALTGTGVGPAPAARRRGRPPQAATEATPTGAAPRKRGRSSTFAATKEELSKLRADGVTAKAMAAKYGVSMATINLHLRKHGLTSKRRGRPAKAAKK
jgi:hypothetical protein